MTADYTYSREEILARFPLLAELERRSIKLVGSGKQRKGNRCASKQHGEKHLCVSFDFDKEVWHCNDCDVGGSVVDWIARADGISPVEVFRRMAKEIGDGSDDAGQGQPEKAQLVATYDYTDEKGDLLYQAIRYHPKDFRQRRPDDQGGWIWKLDGITRVLYRLPEVLNADTVFVAEGEKDVDSLRKLGLVATCNVGGAGKWLDAYSDVLKGKHVIVIPDNDEAGRKHGKKVIESLADRAFSTKLVPMPAPHKDASDFLVTFKDNESAKAALMALVDKAAHIQKPIPLFNMQELEARYTEMVRNVESVCFDLGRFLPSLGRVVRKLIPGQLMVILASTGVGKTALLQSMARAASPLATLFFELELPAEDMFERFVQMEIGCHASDIEQEYRSLPQPIYQHYRGLSHIIVCPESGLHVGNIESLIERSELKFGKKPALVFVDYIGLIRSPGAKSRYEAVSDAAEQLKVIAKRTRTIIVMASQIGRPDQKRKGMDVRLRDGKDSGSIENSAGVVLGAWRPEADELVLKVLKNTRGRTGAEVRCNFDGATMRITEKPMENPYDK